MRNDLGVYAESVVNWTVAALDCYKLRCNCSKCAVKPLIKSQPCQMKAIVIELIRTVGYPKEENCKSWSFKGYGRKKDFSKSKRKNNSRLFEKGLD